MTTIRAHRALFEGAVSFDENPTGVAPVRLPEGRAALFPAPEDQLMVKARMTSGVRLRLSTDSRRLMLDSQVVASKASELEFELPGPVVSVISTLWLRALSAIRQPI